MPRFSLIFLLLLQSLPLYGDGFLINVKPERVRIALLHLAPDLGELEHNTKTIIQAMALAKEHDAQWVLTPELTLTGYKFAKEIGVEWITAGPDQYVQQLSKKADQLNLVLFLSHLEKPEKSDDEVYNTLFVIDREGDIVGRHRKINTIPGSEAWSTAGDSVNMVAIDGIRTGLLICADAWPKVHAQKLKEQGAELLLSSANWPPGEYGPGSSWLDRSVETGLPVFINNRTGAEGDFDMSKGESAVVIGGEKQIRFSGPLPVVVLFDWLPNLNKVTNEAIISLDLK